jgi:hypothetical protein
MVVEGSVKRRVGNDIYEEKKGKLRIILDWDLQMS